jgi:hypothetical protein
MKFRLLIVDENGPRTYESADVQDMHDAASMLQRIAFEHDPAAHHRPTSAVRITRLDLTWEA